MPLQTRIAAVLLVASLAPGSLAQSPPRDAVRLDAPELPADFRLHVDLSGTGGASVSLGGGVVVKLTGGGSHDVAVEHPVEGAPVLRVWSGDVIARGPEEVPAMVSGGAVEHPGAAARLDSDFVAEMRFSTTGDGTLFAKCPGKGNWAPNAKALFVRDGRLVFDIGWVGALGGGPRVDDGKPHRVVARRTGKGLRLWLDGALVAENPSFHAPDVEGHVLRMGRATPDFAGDLRGGRVEGVRIWSGGMEEARATALIAGGSAADLPGPTFAFRRTGDSGRPVVKPEGDSAVTAAWVQALERSDHAEIVRGWNDATLAEGRRIYSTLCVACHGTREQPGSLPTALRFASGAFKNGADPYSMHRTLTHGFGQMVAQPQYTTAQKYAVIQYIRETFLRPHNPSQFVPVTPALLAGLPRGKARAAVEREDRSLPEYRRMDFGPALFWTFEVARGNIAQKGLAVRLDDGPGGVSMGRAWMVYDHETMRVASANTGEFVDWKGIAFDGSHGTHTRMAGEAHFVNPPGPGWASPLGDWNDPRPQGRDGRPYGPMPRDWMRFLGLRIGGDRPVLVASIGGVTVHESPDWIDYGATPVFVRSLEVGAAGRPLRLRVAPDSVQVFLAGDGKLSREQGFWVAELPGGSRTRLFVSRADASSLASLAGAAPGWKSPAERSLPGTARWAQDVLTTSESRPAGEGFVVDDFPLPLKNPWQSWMRPGGFDFTPDGKGAVVATWNGDVWRVEGIRDNAPAPLRWRRIAAGLFQPLGVKHRGKDLFVTCRDQLARLADENGDGEIDWVECFNSDHQVTEHFHEFAMGLQTDPDGNFYYAKSGRHALPAVVPHHGTLLRVTADGSRTDILATGFRAANGVARDDDGTFWVTDQEGFWTPKNRINRIKPGGFYGNMFGYTDVTDTSDAAMEQPVVWVTNDKDRSPAELVRVPSGTWGTLGGALLNLSYGTGRVFVVANEEVHGRWQGAVCELPIPAFATGIMRGRFGPDDALYACGMFAWAGNATAPGGFHRLRRAGGKAACVPMAVHAREGALRVTFSEPLDPSSIDRTHVGLRVWKLRRSANYGSPHLDEHPVEVGSVTTEEEGRVLVVGVPGLAPTPCYELRIRARGKDGMAVERSLHGTIHALAPGRR